MKIRVGDFVSGCAESPLAGFADATPWSLTANALEIVHALVAACGSDYEVRGDIAVHSSAQVETGASLKGPLLIGPGCFVASTALLRGGCWLERGCIIGPSAELKSSFVFRNSKLAHLNFVGDSVLGAEVNIEAGAMIANYRNERAEKIIRIATAQGLVETGVDKFGAMAGDGTRIGANSVIAPGALLQPRTIVQRLALVDQGAQLG